MTLCRLIAAMVLALSAGACDLFGDDDPPPLPGERIPVMLYDTSLEPDPRIQDMDVRLPPPEANSAWPQPGGYPDHAMHHLAIADLPQRAWSVDIGQGSTDELRLLSPPIVADGRLFVLDAESTIVVLDAETGQRLWDARAVDEEEEEGELGGGIAYADGRIYVTTGAAEVRAFDAASGEELWRQKLSAPMRAGPTVAAGRVFAITVDNQIHALDVRDGRKLWNHSGITETAGLLGGASPAVGAGIVAVPFSSGELFALRIENGRPVWSDSLASVRRVDAVSSLSDIRGHPVLDRGWVIAISHGGRMVAVDVRTGVRVWGQEHRRRRHALGGRRFRVPAHQRQRARVPLAPRRPRTMDTVPAALRGRGRERGPDLLGRAGIGERPADRGRLDRRDAHALAL